MTRPNTVPPAARARGIMKMQAMTAYMRARGYKRGPGGMWYAVPGWEKSSDG